MQLTFQDIFFSIWSFVLKPFTRMFQVLGQTQDHRHRVLVAAAKNIKVWFIKVRKIKAIYYTLNMFNLDVTQKCLIAECWCPVGDLDRIQQALQRGNVSYHLHHRHHHNHIQDWTRYGHSDFWNFLNITISRIPGFIIKFSHIHI